MKVLVVVDMQKDFTHGALGSPEAVAIVPAVCDKIQNFSGDVVFTLDTHAENYLDTQEGKNLPIPHCIKGTGGWTLDENIAPLSRGCRFFEKPTFGSCELAEFIKEKGYDEVELIGLCTDICVISNAMLIKAYCPEIKVSVDSARCAGVTPESHTNALSAMKMCQIEIH